VFVRRTLLLVILFASAACTSGNSTTSGSPSPSSVTLQDRPVLQVYSANELSTELTCDPEACTAADLAAPRITLAGDRGTKYQLGSAVFTQDDVGSALVAATADPSVFNVELTLDADGRRALATATKRAVDAPSPQDRIALVVNGRVLAAPVVQAPIHSGLVQMAGDFTPQGAQDIASSLNG
jgi:preprotein translocase subunit SecD